MDNILLNKNLTLYLSSEHKLVHLINHRINRLFLWRDVKGLFECQFPLLQASDTVDIQLNIQNRIISVCPCCRKSTFETWDTTSVTQKTIDWIEHMHIEDVLVIPFEDPWESFDRPEEEPYRIPHTYCCLSFLNKERINFHDKCLRKTLHSRLRGF